MNYCTRVVRLVFHNRLLYSSTHKVMHISIGVDDNKDVVMVRFRPTFIRLRL